MWELESLSFEGGDSIHEFAGKITRVVDGDTVDADVYHHFLDLEYTVKDIRFRLLDIDAPEMRGTERADGEVSKQYLKELIEGKGVVFSGGKKDNFGRILAHIYYQGMNVNEHLMKEGYAKRYIP